MAICQEKQDITIIGAGAAGLMCALTAGQRGRRVLLLEHNKKVGAKILISGGGRCNFTNMETPPTAYLSQNPHFAKSALSRYTSDNFVMMMKSHNLHWHEKTLGQLFCDEGSGAVLKMLLEECSRAGVKIHTDVNIGAVSSEPEGYWLKTSLGDLHTDKLVIATGGVSIPKMGATDFAYEIARQFGLNVVSPEAALVPLVFDGEAVQKMKILAGVSTNCIVKCGKISFRENLLFTHKGLSGPAILQISSYWHKGEEISINLVPDIAEPFDWLQSQRAERPKLQLKTLIAEVLPARLAEWLAAPWQGNLADISNKSLRQLAQSLGSWRLAPVGTEGFKKAEVTRGGVSTNGLSSKTMECKNQPGLYFIGECVDVTGWLGGYNFQWAWASGNACGAHI